MLFRSGNIRPGTLGALSIKLLVPHSGGPQAASFLLGQVGFEPTTSRVSGEVTLSYTTSNLVTNPQPSLCSLRPSRPFCVNSFFFLATARIAADPRFAPANQAGRNSRAELRSLSSTSCNRRSNSSPRHPGVSVARPLLAVLFPLRRESTSQVFVRCSAIELQQLSSQVGIEPTTVGARCNPSLHHAANSRIFFVTSLLRYVITSFSGTPLASRCGANFFRHSAPPRFPGGISAHGLSGFEPEGQSAFLTKK